MTKDLCKAKQLLTKKNYTCVLCKEQTVYTSTERGVLPLIRWTDENADLSGFSAADKIVGKAAAFLYIHLGVKEVYAPVMSKDAANLLVQNGIRPFYMQCAKQIVNRAKTGRCPMECAVDGAESPAQALLAIKNLIWQ